MKRTKKTWQRVMAMALVLMMVLSYVPAGVVAVGEAAVAETKVDTLVQATLVATPNIVEGETEATSYTYNVKVRALGADVTEDAVINTVISGSSIPGCENYVADTDSEFTVTVSYKGVSFSLDSKDAQAGTASGSVTATYKTAYNLTTGQSFDVKDYEPTIAISNATAEGAWTFVESDKYADYVGDGVVTAQDNALNFGTYTYKIGENEPLAEGIVLTVNASAPDYEIDFAGAEAGKWYNTQNGDVIVTVTAKASAVLAVANNLPAVTAEGAKEIGEWSKAADNVTFTKTVTVDKTTTVTAGDQSLTVQIDNVEPRINNVDSYVNEGTTVVEFDVTVGLSGIGEIKINDTVVTDYTTAGDTVKATVSGSLGKDFSIAVTSGAGVTGTSSDNKEPLGKFSVEITEPADEIGTVNNIRYISTNEVFTITVTNAHNGVFTPKVTDKNDVAVAVNWKESVGTFSLDSGETLDGLKVSIVDEKNRLAEDSFETVYKVDNAAPDIKIVGLETKELTYVQNNQDYTVTITDDGVLGDSYRAYYYLEGQKDGIQIAFTKDGQKAEGTFTLTHSQNLVKIVANATDATGNVAVEKTFVTNVLVDTENPVITAEISAVNKDDENVAVRGFYKNGEQQFAILDPAETNETNGDVTLTVVYSLEEDYPDVAALQLDGWKSDKDGKWTKVITQPVAENSTGEVKIIGVTAKDLAGRVPTAKIIIKGTDDKSGELVMDPMEGVYSGSICIDRRTPGTGAATDAPEMELIPSVATTLVAADGAPLYNSDFSFTLNVTDTSSAGYDAGVATVTWTIEGADFLNGTENTRYGAGEYTIPVTALEAGESNNVTLLVTVVDNVGNTFVKTEVFAFDNLVPRVTVSYEDLGEVKNENFFNAPRIATITYEDLNLSVAQYMEDALPEADGVIANGKAEVKVVFDADGHHTLSTYAADLAQNVNMLFESAAVAPYDFYVDTTAPIVEVLQKTEATVIGVNGTTEYYNNEVTYTITASDAYMGTAYKDVAAWVKYSKINAEGEPVEDTIDILTVEGRKWEITIADGETLTDLQVYACDNAGWTTDLVTELDFAETAENSGVYQFTKDTAVDMTPATVSVVRAGELVQTLEGVDYYDDTVTYDLIITDRFLLEADAMNVEAFVDYNSEEKDQTLALDSLEWNKETVNPVYTMRFTVADGDDISAMTILVKDNAGNITETIDVGEDVLTSFEYKNEKNVYTGNRVVVDMTAPEASMVFSDNVKSVYTNSGTVYVVLDQPATGDSGAFASQLPETVTVTITVTDKNIALHESSVKTNSGQGKWTGDVSVNTDSTLKYEQSITVKADKTGAFSFDLNALDLAGNPLEALVFDRMEDGTIVNVAVNNGAFGATVSVDRRRPSSVDDDNAAPVITISPNLKPTTSSNNLELFSNAFNFDLTVTDGEENTFNSGIKTVDWTITDPVGFVVASNVKNKQDAGTYTKNFTIPVGVNGLGESNEVTLTIAAVDNVGNTTTYVKEFAVDNQAPRIVVDYDNNSAQNEKYFKANRTATIQVTDINFNAETTEITTQVSPSGWVQNGDTWTNTCSYTVDGEYTFAVKSTDLANNVTEDAAVNYDGEVAPRDFVIDKTAPVISVTYDPSAPVGKDDQGISYYDKELDVTVTIREVNFRASDVKAQFNSDNALSAFAGRSGIYTAYETFDEGNAYHFSVDYTDLAGNAAITYESTTFSVDLTDPTVEITDGDMTEANLNIVQGDLVLEFTINDEQSNLDSYSVNVTRINNEFKEETVSGKDYYTISSADERTKVIVDFASIVKEKGNDGIYTVVVTAEDYAGRKADMTVQFSLNRFGSTFTTDDPFTKEFLTPSADGVVYQNLVGEKLIFKEINPNKVWQDSTHSAEGSVLTVVVNGTTTVLVEGVDYTVSVAQEGVGNTKWYVYTYAVDPAIFMEGEALVDGRYSLLIYGEDEAGNKNTNESNAFGGIQLDANGEYSGKIEFTLDTTAPIISTTGIETGGSYDAENQKMNIFLSDNTPMSIVVHLNGQLVELMENAGAANAAWLIWDDAEGCYVLNVPELNALFGHQSVEIQVTDAASNSTQAVVDGFTVSSNMFIRFVNSVWLWIVCAILLLLILFLIIVFKRKKKEAAA